MRIGRVRECGGKTIDTAARSALEQARISSTIALKEEELVLLQNAEASATQISSLEREIALLRERQQLIGRRADKTIEVEEQQKARDFAADLNGDLKRAFADAFKSTDNPIKALGESLHSTISARVGAALAESLATNVLDALGLGKGGGGGWGGLIGSLFGATANAKGGVYSSPGLSAYSGTVVNRPTLFPFAKGMGLMGEAGPEAILPLKRGADGKLGVEAGSGGGGGMTVTQNFSVAGPVDRRSEAQIARAATRGLQRAQRWL